MDMEKIIEQISTMAPIWGGRVIGAALLLFAGWVVARVLRGTVSRSLTRAHIDETLSRFFGKFAGYIVLIVTLLGALGMFGVETTSFAAVLAAAGFAVGMALQGTLGHFASGVMLLVFRPFKVGDVVNVAGEVGKVTEVDLFSTELTTPDNRKIVLPNSSIFGSTIENITFHPTRRVSVAVGTDYSADLDATRSALEIAIGKVDGVLADPGSQVYLSELGASSVDWDVRAWCKTEDYWRVREELTAAVKKSLDAKDIGIPFPHIEVSLPESVLQKALN